MKDLSKIRKTYPNNPIIGYFNTNSLKQKIICLRNIISTSKIDILCADETKLDKSFPDSQFKINGYQFPLRRKDQDSKCVGKLEFVRKNIFAKRLSHCESPSIKENGVFCLHIAPVKQKVVRFNQATFTTKDLSKEIMIKSEA